MVLVDLLYPAILHLRRYEFVAVIDTRMNIRFDGKRALVTGAGRGIGRKIATKLAECGAECVALSKTQENLDSLKNEVPGIQTVVVDLADWTATRHALENIGKIDLLVNNAAILIMSSFLETTKDHLDKIAIITLINGTTRVDLSNFPRQGCGEIVGVEGLITKTDVEDVVNAVLFLLSDKASSLNGIALPIDGGFEAN
ncbi:hypothetical protein ACJMK2_038473 [Sinanodonta woodiana]|uniref:L-xylulose reductase n=1 Tax=Sinanodonta woodiana TaxID=1069815 RepID=A0ABD3WA61_SINWO